MRSMKTVGVGSSVKVPFRSSPWARPNLLGMSLTLSAALLAGTMAVADESIAEPRPIQLEFANSSAGISAQHHVLAGITGAGGWMLGGFGVGDFNNNGYPDIFYATGGGGPDRLYINQGDGTFEDEAEAWGVAVSHGSGGVAIGDINNNGHLDIYVTSFGPEGGPNEPGHHRLYRNSGRESFTNIAEAAGVNETSDQIGTGWGAAFGDYNLNGRLDLFVACWKDVPDIPGLQNLGRANKLFRNNGDETFTDVTDDAIPSGLGGVWGFQPAFADMNGNGLPDLLISADFKTSRYFINNGDGTFTNYTTESGTGIDSNGMGQTIGDLNNNGLLDWYVTSVHTINFSQPEPYINGNALYMNQGDHQYHEVAEEVDVHLGHWGWGANAVDLNNNGWLDLVEVNGRPASQWLNQPGKIFANSGDLTFTEVASESGFTHIGEGRGSAWIDTQRNGRPDLLVSKFNGAFEYYRNDSPAAGNYLLIDLDTSNNPLLAPNGFNSRIKVTVGGQTHQRYQNGDPSYLSSSDLIVHFGVGDVDTIDEVRVEWPRGYVTTLTNVDVNQRMTIESPRLADLTGSGDVNVFDLLILLNQWGSCAPFCQADLNNDGEVNVFDLLMLLSDWG